MRRASRSIRVSPLQRALAVTSFVGLLAACDKTSMPRVTFDRPQVAAAPIAVTIFLEPDVTRAVLEQTVCDTQLWQGKIGPTLIKTLEDNGKTRVRAQTITSSDPGETGAGLPPNSYLVRLRMLQHELVGKDRTGSIDQYQARLHVDLAATYQAIRADGSLQTLGEGPLRFSENVSIVTPRVGQAGGRCLTNTLDTALEQATEHLADQLYNVASQFPPDGLAVGAANPLQPGAPVAALPANQPQAAAAPRPASPPVPPPAAQSAQTTQTADTRRTDDPTYAVIISLQSYRESWPGPAAPLDVDRVVRTLRQQAGIPMDHIMVLENELANRLDIEEALGAWLAGRVTPQSVVYVYFAGQAGVDAQTGEIHLAPYDAAPSDATARFLPLRRLQSYITRANPKLGLLYIDARTTVLNATTSANRKANKPAAAPNWRGSLAGPAAGSGLVLQFARTGGTGATTDLLAGLDGAADTDRDGTVTAGELLKTLKPQTLTAPLVSASAPVLNTVLSRPVR